MSFSGLELVSSKIFKAIWIGNHTSIHHNLTDLDNSRLKGHFSGRFSHWAQGCLPIFQGCIEHSNLTSISLYGYFWNSPVDLQRCLTIITLIEKKDQNRYSFHGWRKNCYRLKQILSQNLIFIQCQFMEVNKSVFGAIVTALLWQQKFLQFCFFHCIHRPNLSFMALMILELFSIMLSKCLHYSYIIIYQMTKYGI